VNVRLLGVAQAEALDAADWYDRQTTGVSDRFLFALDTLVANLTAHPRMYGRVGYAPAGREVRRAQIPGFLFLVVYEIRATEVVILSITHARSVRQRWRGRLPESPTN
jgi:plasmid stabilization system protein ParE